MVLTLVRDTFTPSETLGKLLVNRKTFCDTLEPPAVPNAMHPKGAIPMGWYKLQVTMSPVFGRRLPQLCYVPDFEGIRIHAGNNRNHTAGCILVGELSGRSSAGMQTIPTLFRSKDTEQALVAQLLKAQKAHEELYINVTTAERYSSECANSLTI